MYGFHFSLFFFCVKAGSQRGLGARKDLDNEFSGYKYVLCPHRGHSFILTLGRLTFIAFLHLHDYHVSLFPPS